MAESQASGVAAPGGKAAGQFQPTSLYVGDLDLNVTDQQLWDHFSQVGWIVSVRVCQDHSTGRCLGYGYVNYSNHEDAARAMELLNLTQLNNKSIRIMYSHHRDPRANIFIKNLDIEIDDKALQDTFSRFGNILSSKIKIDPNGQSMGYGFVQFDTEEAAKNAINELNGKLVNGKQVYVGPFLSKKEREAALNKTKSHYDVLLEKRDPNSPFMASGFMSFDTEEAAQTVIDNVNRMSDKHFCVAVLRKPERETALSNTKFTNLYVINLAESTTDDDLKTIFGEYGTITSYEVMRDADGKATCFGIVNFENANDAAKAVEALNGKKFDGKEWYVVGKVQKKSERAQELKNRFEQTAREAVDKFPGVNLYIRNLDDSIDDDKLKELFSEFGTITSCKVMRFPSGISRGFGYVAFSTPEEASRALSDMNGKMVISKHLYVALAQHKEERGARLQAQFSQINPVATPPSIAPHMPMYPPGAPGIGQQLSFGQAPTIIPQAGFGYQQQLVPGMRPGGAAPMPSFYVPLVQLGQQGQRPGPVHQTLQPVPMMQQQMLPRGWMYGYPPGGNVPHVPMPGVAGGMLSVPYYMGGMLPRHAAIPQPMPITAMASAFANATPEHQWTAMQHSCT